MSRSPLEVQMDTAEIRKAANLIAVRCRGVVQSCLREEEFAEADREFADIAEAEIRRLSAYRAANPEPDFGEGVGGCRMLPGTW